MDRRQNEPADLMVYTYSHDARAAKIEAITWAKDGSAVLSLEGDKEWVVSPTWMLHSGAKEGGYLVVHEEGPTVFSTAENFEAYHKLKTD